MLQCRFLGNIEQEVMLHQSAEAASAAWCWFLWSPVCGCCSKPDGGGHEGGARPQPDGCAKSGAKKDAGEPGFVAFVGLCLVMMGGNSLCLVTMGGKQPL